MLAGRPRRLTSCSREDRSVTKAAASKSWRLSGGGLTFGLADHDVAVLALPAVVEALHLDVVGRLRLQVPDHVRVLCT